MDEARVPAGAPAKAMKRKALWEREAEKDCREATGREGGLRSSSLRLPAGE